MFLTRNHCLPQLSRILIRHVSTQQQNVSTKLVLFHDPSAQLSHMEPSQKFYEAMKARASIESTPSAQKLHAQLIFTGLDSSVFLQNHLFHLYSNCNLIDDAYWVFNNIEYRNVFSWNTMISGFVDLGRMSEAEKVFDKCLKETLFLGNFKYVSFNGTGWSSRENFKYVCFNGTGW